MFVSVVIPTYNRRPILEKCLSALEDQQLAGALHDYEVVVVDDGSTEINSISDVRAGSLEGGNQHFTENELLGEILRSDGDVDTAEIEGFEERCVGRRFSPTGWRGRGVAAS